MSGWSREKKLAHRRAQGIGPHARCDPELDLMSLVRATGHASPTALGLEIGLSGSSLKTARERGLTIWTADRFATMFKLHPFDVWGERWFEAGERHDARDVTQPGSKVSA